jgi:DNA polymerase-3 subunit epsilon
MVADAPTWDQIAPHLQQLLEGRVVVAHNSKFEAKFTPQDWNLTWVCSKELADRALGKSRWWGGGGLAARLQQAGLLPGPVHSAAGDCLSCLRLVKHLAGDRSPVELVYQN